MTRFLLRLSGTASTVVGLIHLAVGWATYEALSYDALWFAGSGLAVILIGALTLLCTSERAWRGLFALALAANLAGIALSVAFGILSTWAQPQGPMLGGIFTLGSIGCVRTLRQ